MNPYQPGEDNQDPYEVGYKAGTASRDAEVAELKESLEQHDLCSKMIDCWCDENGTQIPWGKAIEIIAIITKMQDVERDRLLCLDFPDLPAECDQLCEQVKMLRSYLEAIIDPIAYMRAKLEEGYELNGSMAVKLSQSHTYLKGLAKEALAATEPR